MLKLTGNFELYLILSFDQIKNFFVYSFYNSETIHSHNLVTNLKQNFKSNTKILALEHLNIPIITFLRI